MTRRPRCSRAIATPFPPAIARGSRRGAALGDIALAEQVDAGAPFALAFAPAEDGAAHRVTFKLFGRDTPMALSDILPLLEHLGLRVTDENPVSASRCPTA